MLLTKDAIAVLERLDRSAEAMASQAASIAELSAGLKVNGVLYSGTVQIGADGTALVNARVDFAAATVRPAGGDVTIATQGQSERVPTTGPGVFLIPGGVERTVAIAGNVLSLWGTAGALVAVTLWTQPQPPESAATHPQALDVVAGDPTRVASSAVSVVLRAANPSRRGLVIFNESTAVLYVCFGPVAAIAGPYTVQVAAGQFFEVQGPPFYRGIVSGIWSVANGAAQVTELQ